MIEILSAQMLPIVRYIKVFAVFYAGLIIVFFILNYRVIITFFTFNDEIANTDQFYYGIIQISR